MGVQKIPTTRTAAHGEESAMPRNNDQTVVATGDNERCAPQRSPYPNYFRCKEQFFFGVVDRSSQKI